MACQCGCCGTPAPPEGTDALQVPEKDVTPEDLQQRVAELDRRVKDLETAA
jgi:hypothetical protein